MSTIDIDTLKKLKRFVYFEANNNRGSGLYTFVSGDTILYKNIVFEGVTGGQPIYLARDPATGVFSMATNNSPIDDASINNHPK
jgi:hypothetical protein